MTAPVPDKAVRLVDDFAKKVASADSLSAGTPTGAYLSKVGIAAQEEESDARAALLAYIAGVVKERDKWKALETEAAEWIESQIALRTDFTGDEPYVGWKGLGLALKEALDERDRLRAELAAIKAAAEDSTEYVLAVVNQELRAELEQARKDAERLDWLDRILPFVFRPDGKSGWVIYTDEEGRVAFEGITVRDAIDAALAGAREDKP